MGKLEKLEQEMIKAFDELCKRVRSEPSFGNSSKSKKDNFLDGAEAMLTEVQYQVKELKDEQV